MDNGWIKLHRKFIEWEWFKMPGMTRLFIYLLLTANHKDKKWRGQIIKRGQLVTGIKSLQNATGLSVQMLRTRLKHLESTSEIKRKSTHHFSLITICNFDEYQGSKKRANTQLTNDQQSNNNQTTTTNKYKTDENEKNEKKKEYTNGFSNFYEAYPIHQNKKRAFDAWQKLKKQNQLPSLDILLAAIINQQENKIERIESGLFTAEWPLPSTWLNGKRWEDEIQSLNNKPIRPEPGEIF